MRLGGGSKIVALRASAPGTEGRCTARETVIAAAFRPRSAWPRRSGASRWRTWTNCATACAPPTAARSAVPAVAAGIAAAA